MDPDNHSPITKEGQMIKYGLITLFCLIFLASCSPTEAQIQAAMDQTQAALPTSTHTPEPTATIEPTPTP